MKTFRLIIAILLFAPVIGCNSQPASKQAESSDSNSDKIEAYYFHFTARCVTCNTIEAKAKENLETFNKNIFNIPLVMQYNKRDLEEEGIPILSIDTLHRDLNSRLQAPFFPASAVKGENVPETMKKIIALTVSSLRKKLE